MQTYSFNQNNDNSNVSSVRLKHNVDSKSIHFGNNFSTFQVSHFYVDLNWFTEKINMGVFCT